MTAEWKKTGAKWITLANAQEDAYGIPRDLLARVLYEESGWRADVVAGTVRSAAGCVGIAQLNPDYFPDAGKNPAADIHTAAYLLAQLCDRFHDWQVALAAYNWGEGNVHHQWVSDHEHYLLADCPPETQRYVKAILADVPVAGALWPIPTTSSSPAGSPPPPPGAAGPSDLPSHKSWWRSVTSIFSTPSPPSSQAPSPPSASPPQGTPSKTAAVNNPGVSMSTPNPALVAAAPSLIAAIQAIQQFETDIGVDPTKWVLTVVPAKLKLLGALGLLVPGLEQAEVGALGTIINTTTSGWITKLQAISAPAKPA